MSASRELPIIDRALDNTALSAYMTCARDYFMSMHLHRRGDGLSPSLAYGSAQHKVMEHHYKTGGASDLVEMIVRSWWEEHVREDFAGDHRTIERVILDYKRYRERWGKRPEDEQGWTVGWPEQPLVEMPFNIRAGELNVDWAGKIDRIIELGGLHYVEDHKTTSRMGKDFFDSFELSNQMMGYTWAAQHLLPGLRIVGVRVNTIHILKEKTGFDRQLFTFTRGQIAEWERNTARWIDRLRRDIAEWPTLEELAAGAEWPLAHFGENGCFRKFGTCGFFKVCKTDPTFRASVLSELPINKWDPTQIED